jgi:hypothetical protein
MTKWCKNQSPTLLLASIFDPKNSFHLPMNKTLLAIVFLLFVKNTFAQLAKSNLPILRITTPTSIKDEPKTSGTIEIFEKGDLSATPIKYNIGVEYRGSSSQNFPKKSMVFETRDAQGKNLNVSLLGLKPENDWVIIAPYSDKSLLRDHLTYTLARQMGHYASASIFVELVVNNNYYGVCFLGEKLKKGKSRVDVATLKPTDISGDDLTGGYIVKVDKSTGAYSKSWRSAYSSGRSASLFQVEYPNAEDISNEQFNYIKNLVDSFESKLQSNNYKDPNSGYAKMIDVPSFADFMLLNELSRNIDGYRLSTYFHKDKDSKNPRICMGPVWDFNLAFGNADYCNGWYTTGWAYKFGEVCPNDSFVLPFWWVKLMTDPAYTAVLNDRWQSYRKTVFSDKNINFIIDSTATLLNDAQERNFIKYPIWGKYVWPNKYIAQNYTDEINYTKKWIKDRIQWLDNTPELLDRALLLAAEPNIESNIGLSPNPTQASSILDFNLTQSAHLKINIYNPTGQIVQQVLDQNMPQGKHQLLLDVSAQALGLYFVKIEINGKQQTTHKLVKI